MIDTIASAAMSATVIRFSFSAVVMFSPLRRRGYDAVISGLISSGHVSIMSGHPLSRKRDVMVGEQRTEGPCVYRRSGGSVAAIDSVRARHTPPPKTENTPYAATPGFDITSRSDATGENSNTHETPVKYG